jgi:anion-transporting  ArsA/GET3 family ATPase
LWQRRGGENHRKCCFGALLVPCSGKKTVVITIDPAKRLATSLGLDTLGVEATNITAALGKKVSGSLHAVLPDTTKTFERFVETMAAGNKGLAQRVLKTSIFKVFAKEFSGTNEYMAMEKLFELCSKQEYDLVVLDTPPSANTRVFLEAPKMLADFFDDRVIKWFITPGSKLLAAGVKAVLSILEKLTGKSFISDLVEFTTALFELRSNFIDNLRNVNELLHQKDVAFLMVTSPERFSKADTQDFVSLLAERDYPFWGFILNRALTKRLGLSEVKTIDTKLVAQLKTELKNSPNFNADELQQLTDSFDQVQRWVENELQTEQHLAKAVKTKNINVVKIADQSKDVHSAKALVKLAEALMEQK